MANEGSFGYPVDPRGTEFSSQPLFHCPYHIRFAAPCLPPIARFLPNSNNDNAKTQRRKVTQRRRLSFDDSPIQGDPQHPSATAQNKLFSAPCVVVEACLNLSLHNGVSCSIMRAHLSGVRDDPTYSKERRCR